VSSQPRGTTLPELLVALGILGAFFGIAVPAFRELVSQAAVAAACHDVASLFTRARGEAVFVGADVGVKWETVNGDYVLTLYRDGNGNGVTTADIRRGRDVRIFGPMTTKRRWSTVSISFLPGFSGRDPSGDRIGNLADPIRFGNGSICTFAPSGRSSPGTIYVSDGRTRQACVRVTPLSSRIQIFEWHPGANKWVRKW
jgi:Tfp pilus assembly major pilin PilA